MGASMTRHAGGRVSVPCCVVVIAAVVCTGGVSFAVLPRCLLRPVSACHNVLRAWLETTIMTVSRVCCHIGTT